MKKVIEWLKELDEPYRSEAIENCKKDTPYTGNKEAEFLSDALGDAFVWKETKQGHVYWESLHEKLMQNETP
jgi:hypothetical protein